YQIDGGGPSSGNTVVNNTIVNASDSRWAPNIQNGSTDNSVYNNILDDANPSQGSIDISSDSLTGFASDYNIVVDAFTTDDGNTVQSLAQWRSSTGQDGHSLIATPSKLFVDAAANDCQLSATSPAIDAGTSTDTPSTDILGNPRPRGPGYDIGCYEYQV